MKYYCNPIHTGEILFNLSQVDPTWWVGLVDHQWYSWVGLPVAQATGVAGWWQESMAGSHWWRGRGSRWWHGDTDGQYGSRKGNKEPNMFPVREIF